MIHYQCPNMGFVENWPKTIFLAGNISNTWNWQNKMVEMLGRTELTVFNPRREAYDCSNPALAKQQIAWEYFFLREAAAISFWFDKDTIAPITLFELGFQLGKLATYWETGFYLHCKKIFIGVDKEFTRRIDIEEQLYNIQKTKNLNIEIVYHLDELAGQIIEWSFDKYHGSWPGEEI